MQCIRMIILEVLVLMESWRASQCLFFHSGVLYYLGDVLLTLEPQLLLRSLPLVLQRLLFVSVCVLVPIDEAVSLQVIVA